MRWRWRRVLPPEPEEPEENGTIHELKEAARLAHARAQRDRQRAPRLASSIAALPDDEFVSRVAEILRTRHP